MSGARGRGGDSINTNVPVGALGLTSCSVMSRVIRFSAFSELNSGVEMDLKTTALRPGSLESEEMQKDEQIRREREERAWFL